MKVIGELRPARHACGTLHLPNVYNPNSRDTYCVCGKQRWDGHVGVWRSRQLGDEWDTYFLHAEHCPDRMLPTEFVIEADLGKLTASFPTYSTWDAVEAQHDTLRRMGRGVPKGMGEDWPRVLWRVGKGPWLAREPMPAEHHLCGVPDTEPTLFDLLEATR